MAIRSEKLSSLEEQDFVHEEDEQNHHAPPFHHPSAPADELFDISTTVDPGYIISLIRKLLPRDIIDSPHGVGACDESAEESKFGDIEECTVSPLEDKVSNSTNNKIDAMDINGDLDNHGHPEGKDDFSFHENTTVSAGKETWEECGCILWDLSVSKNHAEFMVENFVLEVLSANLVVSQSSRVKEICLGIIGNLACHEAPRKQIAAAEGLIQIIVDQLFLDDISCLCEACRLLTLGLQGRECILWAEALQIETVLCRVLWIAENALNPQVIEKSVGLLLAFLETQQEAVDILIPPLMKLGLASLLINLFAFEMSKLGTGRIPERYSALDIILRAIEALSVIDGYSQEICLNNELFQLICDLIKVDDKVELATSCVTAAVLFANILSDVPDHASDISHDIPILQGLFEIFHFASDDLEALNALWSILARLLVRVEESQITLSILRQYVAVLVSHTDFIEEYFLDHEVDTLNEQESLATACTRGKARSIVLRRIISILEEWTRSKDCITETGTGGENDATIENVERLLHCCCKYTQ